MVYGGSSYHNDDHSDHNDAQGDSGGALLAQDRELLGWSAVGIVSYQPGIECGTENYVVFTEIRYEDQDPELDTSLLSLQEISVVDRGPVRPPAAQGINGWKIILT